MSDTVEIIGSLIRELRKKSGLTQEQLAELANLHWTYVSGVERGVKNPSLVSLEKIAVALKIPLSELFKPLNHSKDFKKFFKSPEKTELISQFFALLENQDEKILEELIKLSRFYVEIRKQS